ncbi:sensor histidine kinase [Polyangium aurulentum]|uniref:sensor histidine kinase n=1 Tax=Polyangium aurulentum TaxID=2567896 RepID=UPI00146EC7E7|nr:ATP-binding protein [Polyangium aurulentum]UQA58479.1 PAS domain S-box protein [Polyangium aurulentum]
MLAPLVLTGVLGAALVFQIAALRKAMTDASQLTATLRAARKTHRLMVTMQLDAHRYQVLQDPLVLARYRRVEATLDERLGELERVAESGPVAADDVGRLRAQRDLLVRHMEKLIGDRGGDDATQVEMLREGERLMSEIDQTFDAILGAREELRDLRARQALSSTDRVAWTTAALTLALGAMLAMFVRRQLQRSAGEYARALEEEKRRTGELAESEERFRLLVSAVEEYAIYLLDPEGRVMSWNAGAQRIEGYRAEEIVGRSHAIFYPDEEQALGEPARHLAEAAAKGQLRAAGQRVRKGGDRFHAEVAITALRGPGGRIRGFAWVTHDVTELKQYQDELLAMTESLERRVAERTRSLEEANRELEAFTYSVSHDLRAPLRAMQGLATLLAEDYGDQLEDEGREYACRILRSAERMQALIEDLLLYSRLSRAELSVGPVPLGEVIEEALEPLRGEIEAKAGEVIIDGPLPSVMGNRGVLVQVAANLLGNAIKFGRGEPPRVRLRAELQGERTRLWVEDNGIGIAPEHRERIFGVFERLHAAEAYPGTGVGLAIVKRGAERMGGAVGVESVVGEGSRFWVELALAMEGE